MENNLKIKDIDILIDALEAWEYKDTAMAVGEVMLENLSKNLFEEGSEEFIKIKKEGEIRKAKREQEAQDRKYKSIMLKAKLIQLKEDITIEQANGILNK